MCICTNCQFYKSCWVQNGIQKIPKHILRLSLSMKLTDIKNTSFFNQNSLNLKLILNSFIIKQNYEFDIIECDAFCELPGVWIK